MAISAGDNDEQGDVVLLNRCHGQPSANRGKQVGGCHPPGASLSRAIAKAERAGRAKAKVAIA